MNRLGYSCISLVLASMLGVAARADDAAFDDRFYVAPMGSYARAADSRGGYNGYGGTLAAGKSLMPHLGVELLGSYLDYKGRSMITGGGSGCGLLGLQTCPYTTVGGPGQHIASGGGGLNLFLSPSNHGLFFHGDAMGGSKLVYDGGLGFDAPVTNYGIGVRLEALYHKEATQRGEPLFNLGLIIPIGSVPVAAQPAPQPVAVVPVEEPAPAPAPVEAPPPAAPPPCQPPAPGQPISLEGCKTGDTIVLHGVNFEFNKATLTVNAKTLLDQVADALLARKDIKVEIDGHTDGKGSAPYNQKLSEHRAAAVKKYLVGRGIDAGRMSTRGFGKSMPVADNSTDEGRELNRRVELKVTDSDASATGASAVPAETPPAAAAAPPSDAPAAKVMEPAAAAPQAAEPAAPAASSEAPASDAGASVPADTASTSTAAPAPATDATAPAAPAADSAAPAAAAPGPAASTSNAQAAARAAQEAAAGSGSNGTVQSEDAAQVPADNSSAAPAPQ